MPRFTYFAGVDLSAAELAAARLDGHLVELGEGYIPADAADSVWMRANSLRYVLGTSMAATHIVAAWVHGLAPSLPARLTVQRASLKRLHHVISRRLHYRDGRLTTEDAVEIAGITVTSVVRTITDLLRSAEPADGEAAHSALELVSPAEHILVEQWLKDHAGLPGIKRARGRLGLANS